MESIVGGGKEKGQGGIQTNQICVVSIHELKQKNR